MFMIENRHNHLSTLNYSTGSPSLTIASMEVHEPAIFITWEEACSVKKLSSDRSERDLCRTSENKEAKYCPLQGFSVFDQMDIGDLTNAQTVLERKVGIQAWSPKKTPKYKLQELVFIFIFICH